MSDMRVPAPEWPQGCVVGYTTTTARIVRNAAGDPFVELLVPVRISERVRDECPEYAAWRALMTRLMRAASKAAAEFECLDPRDIEREFVHATEEWVRPCLPPNPPRP